jgi:hypothetical protein
VVVEDIVRPTTSGAGWGGVAAGGVSFGGGGAVSLGLGDFTEATLIGALGIGLDGGAFASSIGGGLRFSTSNITNSSGGAEAVSALSRLAAWLITAKAPPCSTTEPAMNIGSTARREER